MFSFNIWKIFENCFIKSLEESLNFNKFHEKFEMPWRKLIQYIFKLYADGMYNQELLVKIVDKYF